MLRLVKDNPLQALEFLLEKNLKSGHHEAVRYKSKDYRKTRFLWQGIFTRQTFEGEYANFLKSYLTFNGFAMLNIDKNRSNDFLYCRKSR